MEFVCAANWKMNKNPEQTQLFFDQFLPLYKKLEKPQHLKILFFPPAVNFCKIRHQVKGTDILWGAQNAYPEKSGAFTGETSPEIVKSMGGQFILIGHSERRQYFQEKDDFLNRKVHFTQQLGLSPMLCIGETLEEREKGLMESVLTRQLSKGLENVDFAKPLYLAYEPVWAIGTGKVATPAQVAETHLFIRQWLKKTSPQGEKIPILYGGSAKADNAGALSQIPNVNGFLVGGASLEPESFFNLIKAALSK